MRKALIGVAAALVLMALGTYLAAFAEKYGLVDAWYGLLLRRSPVPVRLVPAQP